ncbi:SMP-30/gluconolactonase/LRE family protein [Actinomycetospora sp. TBRC 11914]|uniref:SMP-30/gluconolactonase/LRE family protein n=1 Tax=Actinomycetospora sp. TBRC 11914 TaxID=2729387 RepID=UPI00145CA241|nr:SMP-30/gluconolactonase/LRE family protein [Actinomycetospora sp. TBRC 11914]NMO93727.1 SMP-30/gluconolactonase/LRE family protein [Actinomycetospora sp. TBRC 11914]
MSHDVRTVVDGMSFTEGPRWHSDRLWFVDFYTHRVYSAAEDGADLRVEAEVPEQPSGLGWLPDGRLLIVSQLDQRILRRESDGTLATHADLSDAVPAQLNDMVVDGSGRGWVGNFGFDLMGGAPVAPTAIHRVDPDGSVHLAASDLWFPNGSAVSPDGRTLVVDETFGNRVSAFDIADDGGLGRRRTWASFGPLPDDTDLEKVLGSLSVAPDGCSTFDAEGCLWIADAGNGRAIRVREGGEILDEVSPGTGVYACGLGGADGRTLFLCTAPDFLAHNRKAAREAAVMATTVEVPAA